MTILDQIIATKKLEVIKQKSQVPITALEKSQFFGRVPISLKRKLKNPESTGIIAEYKRQSPSKGIINDRLTVAEVTTGYLNADVAAQSILTDYQFFGGSPTDISEARKINTKTPILRKDFIIDEYQIIEAKSMGADAILLIATSLTCVELKQFHETAQHLGLDVLFEVHTKQDLDKINDLDHKMIGINNRNLKTFTVNLEYSLQLADQIPDSAIKVSESGISDPKTVADLKQKGFHGFLIGEHFMSATDPGKSAKQFIQQISAI